MTHFFEKRSARPPMARRPAMLVARIVMEATRHVEFSSASPSLVRSEKPWSRKTNFMWKLTAPIAPIERSEERRVGKEGRCRWAPDHQKKIAGRGGVIVWVERRADDGFGLHADIVEG